jgi:DNA topoisomerase-1
MGPHPTDGEPVNVYEGRYGPYVKHGETNASLPRGVSPEQLGMEQALSLLAERAATAKPKAKGKARAKKSGAGAKASGRGGAKRKS